jgi:hypothetical protein
MLESGGSLLLVLDDLWSEHQITQLLGSGTRPPHGSQLLLTSRRSDILAAYNAQPVKPLPKASALALLAWHACGQASVPADLAEVAEDALRGCGGLPLAVKVLGGALRRGPATQKAWKVIPDRSTIGLAGKFSFHALNWRMLQRFASHPNGFVTLNALRPTCLNWGFGVDPTHGTVGWMLLTVCLSTQVNGSMPISPRLLTFSHAGKGSGIQQQRRKRCRRGQQNDDAVARDQLRILAPRTTSAHVSRCGDLAARTAAARPALHMDRHGAI